MYKASWTAFGASEWTNVHFSIQSSDEEVFYYLLVDSVLPIEMLVSFSALVHWCVTEGKANTQKYMSVLSFPILEYACAVVFVCCLIGQFESLAIVWNSQIGFKEYTNIQAMLDHYFIDDGIFMKESFFCLLWFAGSFSSVYFWNGFPYVSCGFFSTNSILVSYFMP